MKRLLKNNIIVLALVAAMAMMAGCVSSSAMKWDKCTKSSNWTGANASKRMMNILSPKFDDATFKARVKWQKDRGCNYVNLFVTNKGDGEGSGYSIWGTTPFSAAVPNDTSKLMIERMKYCKKQGLGVWIWLLADDSSAWNKTILSNISKFVDDLKAGGFLDKDLISGVVLGLEMNEYMSAAQANLLSTTLRNVWNGKVATHEVSGKYSFAGFGDIVFYQQNPGVSAKQLINECNAVKAKTGKPVCCFEIERQEARDKCQEILNSGAAFSVGNW